MLWLAKQNRLRQQLAMLGLALGMVAGGVDGAWAQPGKAPPDPQIVDDGEGGAEAIPQQAPPGQAPVPFDPQRPDDNPATESTTTAEAQRYPRIVKLELSPAAEPSPALRYSLLVPVERRQPGNAATRYYRAMILHLERMNNQLADARKEYNDSFNKLLEQPISEFDLQLADRWFPAGSVVISEVRAGAMREQCDWSFQLQTIEGVAVLGFLLPDLQEMRGLNRMLTIDAKRQIVQKNWERAIEDLQGGYQVGIHCNAEPLLIANLVGIACASQMNGVVEQMCGQPDSPNLYWALATLPQHHWSMQRSFEIERDMVFRIFPYLRDAETTERTPEEWQRLFDASLKEIYQFNLVSGLQGPGYSMQSWEARMQMAAMMAITYTAVKEDLIKSGMKKEQVEKMPIGQVAAIQTARTFRHVSSEMLKWNYLPYDKVEDRQRETMDRLREEGWMSSTPSAKDPMRVCSILLPAMETVRQSEVRFQQQIAGLQVIEAIRMHLAMTGKMPKKLEQIEVVPVPDNPATGKPFPYTIGQGGVVELHLEGLPEHLQVIYQLKAR